MVRLETNYLRTRGVVVRERGGTPFRQTYWSRNGAPANIVGHRWNTNTEAFPANHVVLVRLTLDQFIFWPKLPQTRHLSSKISKNFRGDTPDSLSGRGRPPPTPTPSTATCRARGRKLPCCWDLGLGNRSPKSKFTTTPLLRTYWTDLHQFHD